MFEDDLTLELARLVRECTAKAEAKVRARQLGLGFAGLEHPLASVEGHEQAEGHYQVVAAEEA